MFSVIMPTMWRSHRTVSLINTLCASDNVSELIIIDNEPNSRPNFDIDSKVRIYEQKENIYVNPAWNLGVEKAGNLFLCIINDDITLDFDHGISLVKEFLNNEGAVIGIHPNSYEINEDDVTIGVTPGDYIGDGWGCCIFMRKDDWIPVPDKYKVWYGDNWIANNSKSVYSLLKAVQTEMQTTSSAPDIIPVVKEDVKTFDNEKL